MGWLLFYYFLHLICELLVDRNPKKQEQNCDFLTFIDFLRNEIDGSIKLHSRIRNNIFHIKVTFSLLFSKFFTRRIICPMLDPSNITPPSPMQLCPPYLLFLSLYSFLPATLFFHSLSSEHAFGSLIIVRSSLNGSLCNFGLSNNYCSVKLSNDVLLFPIYCRPSLLSIPLQIESIFYSVPSVKTCHLRY
jgi:hypothetical protein